jgi:photosystem II stability/assembly factor-like uncharacterized protein
MPTIFISYRRKDAEAETGRLYDRLSRKFGKSNVFRDLDTIDEGKWTKQIEQAIESCYVFVAVIGNKWLSATDDTTGERRLLDPQDYLRKEIKTALDRHIPVIPVLVQGASMPTAQDLPQELHELLQFQSSELSRTRWDYDIRKLIKRIRSLLPLWRRFRWQWIIGGTALVLVLLVAYLLWPRSPRQWQIYQIEGSGLDTKTRWHDIAWKGVHGWLAGSIYEGGDGGDVGNGILLRTESRGGEWERVDVKDFDSKNGKFKLCAGGKDWEWREVGPIESLWFVDRRPVGSSTVIIEGWLASWTGIYYSTDRGRHWQRKTPEPSTNPEYTHFSDITGFTGGSRTAIYAVGWPGIFFLPHENGTWEVQKQTCSYAIGRVTRGPNSEVWAVGHSEHNTSKGAVYFLSQGSNEWRTIDLPIDNEGLGDIYVPDRDDFALVVGSNGLILRGVRGEKNDWKWKKVDSTTTASLHSIASDRQQVLWIVGNNGTILYSLDKGQSWKPSRSPTDKDLNRVRFFGNDGWIVGSQAVVLTSNPIPN